MFKMMPDNKALEYVMIVGYEFEFRLLDGRYHKGFFLKKVNDGDDPSYIFENEDGTFEKNWWQVIKLMNEDKLRVTWMPDLMGEYPPNYEYPV